MGGTHPVGGYGGRGDLLFYVGAKGRYYVVVPDKSQKVKIFQFTLF